MSTTAKRKSKRDRPIRVIFDPEPTAEQWADMQDRAMRAAGCRPATAEERAELSRPDAEEQGEAEESAPTPTPDLTPAADRDRADVWGELGDRHYQGFAGRRPYRESRRGEGGNAGPPTSPTGPPNE